MGMPAAEFIEKAWQQLTAGSEHVIVGSAGPEKPFMEIVDKRREHFETVRSLAPALRVVALCCIS
jgi:hypothetical protein